MKNVLVVDDDNVSLAIIEKVLSGEGYEVESFSSAIDALTVFRQKRCDLVLSDYFMPGMNGDEFLKAVRSHDTDVAFVFLTSNTDVEIAAALVRSGADDYLSKPILSEELIFRVRKALLDKEHVSTIRQVEEERRLLDLENRKLVNWRLLYGSKDATQTGQMINLLSRTINQSGGFLWLDLLKDGTEVLPDGGHRVSENLFSMIVTAAESQREVFNYITFIGKVDELELDVQPVAVATLVDDLVRFAKTEFPALVETLPHSLAVALTGSLPQGQVAVDLPYLREVMREILINATKYSPLDSRIIMQIDRCQGPSGDNLEIMVRNVASVCRGRDDEGRPIVGIPYDYSELVFDMFYTIEQFPVYLPGERWRDGTGLFVARKLLKRLGGWLKATNGIDYTGDMSQTHVELIVTLPVTR